MATDAESDAAEIAAYRDEVARFLELPQPEQQARSRFVLSAAVSASKPLALRWRRLLAGEDAHAAKMPVDCVASAYNTRALHAAAELGNLALARALVVDFGAALNARAENHCGTALMAAAANGKLQVVRFLVGQGARVNALDALGRSALYSAAFNGHLATVSYLLDEAGCDPLSITETQLESVRTMSSGRAVYLRVAHAALRARLEAAMASGVDSPLGTWRASHLFDRRVWRVVGRFIADSFE